MSEDVWCHRKGEAAAAARLGVADPNVLTAQRRHRTKGCAKESVVGFVDRAGGEKGPGTATPDACACVRPSWSGRLFSAVRPSTQCNSARRWVTFQPKGVCGRSHQLRGDQAGPAEQSLRRRRRPILGLRRTIDTCCAQRAPSLTGPRPPRGSPDVWRRATRIGNVDCRVLAPARQLIEDWVVRAIVALATVGEVGQGFSDHHHLADLAIQLRDMPER